MRPSGAKGSVMDAYRHLVVAFGLAGLIVSGGRADGAQEPATAAAPPLVITAGEAVVRVAPDLAYVALATETRARSPQDAQRQNAEAMTAVQQKVLQGGVPKDAVRTTGYDLQPEYDYVSGRQVLRGYVARNNIEIRVDDLARVGAIIDLAVGSGATAVSGVRFDLKNRDAVERDALKRAVADARARADAAAAGAGRVIDRVLRIEESRTGEIAMPVMRMAAAPAPSPSTPIAPSDVEVRAQVTLTAILK
jgi:uncharacterized protein